MRTLFAMFAMLLYAESACAQPAEELVKKLGSSNYVEREKAAKTLDQLGRLALPALRAKLLKTDLETHRRVELLINQIEERVLIEQILWATPVRVQHGAVDITDALRLAERELRMTLRPTTEKRAVAPFDTGTLPYWEAWGRFRDAAALYEFDQVEATRPFLQERLRLSVGRNCWAEDTRSSLRVRVRWVGTMEEPGAPPRMQFAFELRSEPRWEFKTEPRLHITSVVGIDGKPVPPRDLTHEASRNGGLLQLHWLTWTRPERTIKELHGRLQLEVNVYEPKIALPGVLKAVGTEAGPKDARMKVVEVDREGEEIVIYVHVPELSVRAALEHLRLVDAHGMAYPQVRGRFEEAAQTVHLIYAANVIGKDNPTLIWTKSSRAIAFDMPFLLRDIPLPK